MRHAFLVLSKLPSDARRLPKVLAYQRRRPNEHLSSAGFRYRDLIFASLASAVLVGIASCGGDGATRPVLPPPGPPPPPPQAAPVPVGSIAARTVDAGQSFTVEVSSHFRDPDGDALTYTAESSDESVVTARASGSQVSVVAIGPGSATVTVTASDPGGRTAAQSFDVAVRGSIGDDFGSAGSLNDWRGLNDAGISVGGGVLSVTNRTQDRLGIAERASTPTLTAWGIQARMGRTTRRASPGVVSLTGHRRFTASRLVLRTLDESGSDRSADSRRASGNFEFALFDRDVGEWIRITNMSGGSATVREGPDEFTDIAFGHQGGDFVAYAGTGRSEELFRFDLASSTVDGVAMLDIMEHVTGVWLVNQGDAGLTALHDWVEVTGTGSSAPVPDAAEVAASLDVAARSASVAGPDADRAALEAFYEAAGGPNWTNNDGWLTNAPLDDWYGVTTEAGHVTELGLGRNNLVGKIAPELGSLTALESLGLSQNQLTGEIPSELGDLGDLESLQLDGNYGLSGGIPPELGRLAALRFLNIQFNELTGEIPRELGGLSNLESLSLGSNELIGEIPSELGNLAALTYLNIQENALTGGIPPELGGLSNLRGLHLNHNELAGRLPTSFPDLSLEGFWWYGNAALCAPDTSAFRAWLAGIGDHRPGAFCVEGPEVVGTVPAQVVSVGQTATVDVSPYFRDSDGDPLTYAASTSHPGIARAAMSGTALTVTGVAPGSATVTVTAADPAGLTAALSVSVTVTDPAGDRSALEAFYRAAGGPNWTNNDGWLTNAPLGNWHGVTTDSQGRVTSLDLTHNNLVGEIAPELGSVSSLIRLHLSNNGLAGAIPPELGNLTALTFLTIEFNQLIREIPSELGSLSRLMGLTLAGNRLTGDIPSELGGLTGLESLYLHGNELTGEIPPELGKLINLTDLRLHSNELTGTIPSELGSLTRLGHVFLHGNELTGEIPPELGNLTDLQSLVLSRNELTGEIPYQLGDLANLWQLTLDNNALTGEIPSELGDLTELRRLALSHNELLGQLPASFLNLSLDFFSWDENAALCAPGTSAFRAWLAGIGEHQPGPYCVEDDHSCVRGQETHLVWADSVSGVLTAGDEDCFVFRAPAGQTAGRLTAWTTGAIDTYGTLYDQSYRVIDENDDVSEELTETLNFQVVDTLAAPGTYYVRVTGHDSSIAGPYAIHADDHGNAIDFATWRWRAPAVDSVVNAGSISVSGNRDFFVFALGAATTINVGTSGATDTSGELYDASGRPIAEDDDGGSGANFLISRHLEPGLYFVMVEGYDSDSTGPYEVSVWAPSTGSGATNLTNNSALDWYPAWSPDGTRIAFQSDRDGNWDIYAMNADGSDPVRLTNNSVDDHGPAWSPDGTRIAFASVRDGNYEIYAMNADGSDPVRLTNNSAAGDVAAAWSRDGTRIAFQSDRDGNYEIYVMNADGSDPVRLTNNSADDLLPAWSPDGTRIAFQSDRDGNAEVYVMNADGSGLVRLTNNSAGDGVAMWSPDGTRIAFTSERDGNAEIYVMNADGSGPVRLTNNSAVDFAPAWSPDGTRIAFTSDRAGNYDIYVMPVPAGESPVIGRRSRTSGG